MSLDLVDELCWAVVHGLVGDEKEIGVFDFLNCHRVAALGGGGGERGKVGRGGRVKEGSDDGKEKRKGWMQRAVLKWKVTEKREVGCLIGVSGEESKRREWTYGRHGRRSTLIENVIK